MENRELENINESGELIELTLTTRLTVNDAVLIKDFLAMSGKIVLHYVDTNDSIVIGNQTAIADIESGFVRLANLSIANIDADTDRSAVTREWTLGKFGNYTLSGDIMQVNGNTAMEADASGITIGEDFPSTLINKLILNSASSDPTVPAPAPGQMYFNNTSFKARCFDGSIWNDMF